LRALLVETAYFIVLQYLEMHLIWRWNSRIVFTIYSNPI